MNYDYKIYLFSSVSVLQSFTDFLNPLLSFVLIIVTILYTFQKFRNERTKAKNYKRFKN